MDSDQENDDCDYHTTEQQTKEHSIELELDEFLANWKKEIFQRNMDGQTTQSKSGEKQTQDETIDTEEQAKRFFQRASELEREGKLYEAIKYYRAAMQLVPDIEFRMARKGPQSITTVNESTDYLENEDNDTNEPSEHTENLVDSLQHMQLSENELSTTCVKKFPQQATHVSSLPSEVLIYIFRWVVSSDLDVRSLEQCARVCRGFYICARDPHLWKMICQKIWGLNTGNPVVNGMWRQMFISRPRVFFNGVYISRTTYVRQGEQSLDTFYSPWHLVEYYRYIRFFPDGVVLFYTSADEPRAVVGRLKSRHTIRDSSLIYGNYRLQSNRVVIVAKRIPQRTPAVNTAQRRGGKDAAVPDNEPTMHMELEIRDVTKKKYHQIVWTHYEIKFTNKRTGEERSSIMDIDDQLAFPSLVFSRVKSYTSAAEQLLE